MSPEKTGKVRRDSPRAWPKIALGVFLGVVGSVATGAFGYGAAWASGGAKVDSVEVRVTAVEARLDRIEDKLDRLLCLADPEACRKAAVGK